MESANTHSGLKIEPGKWLTRHLFPKHQSVIFLNYMLDLENSLSIRLFHIFIGR